MGDILVACVLQNEQKTEKKNEEIKWIFLYSPPVFSSAYFTPDSLVQLLNRLDKQGWHISIRKESDNCMDNGFYMECPEFDRVLSLASVSAVSYGHPVRDYSHPIDGKIVKVLDMPLVNSVFKTFVDTTVDAQFGQTLASAVPVNEHTFPQLNELVEHCVRVLGIRRPYVVVSESYKMNACTTGSDENPYIILGSMLTLAFTPEQLQFVIGHECGHIAMGHVVYHSAISMASSLANMIPIIGPTVYNLSVFPINAWSRRSEITADRAGLLCCGDIDVAQRALMQLEMGFIRVPDMDVQEYVDASHRYRKGGILRNLGEYAHSHPLLPKRIEALNMFANSELYYDVTGHALPKDAISQNSLNKKVEDIIRIL